MKAIREIGIQKSLRFLLFSLIEVILNLVMFPNFRSFLLRLLGAKIGKNSLIFNVTLMNLYRGSFANLTIGDNCYLGRGVLLDLAGNIDIGDNVTLSERCNLITHLNVGFKDHALHKHYPPAIGKISIADNTFIGINSTILTNVSIGSHSMIGSGAVVNQNIPANSVAVGVPAKVIRMLK